MEVTIHIKRGTQGRQYYQSYRVEVENPNITVLDLLFKVRGIDGSLSFRYACRMGVCGACAMVINGVPRLACTVKLSDLGTKEIFVEPIKGKNIIKDLVTDT
ncbi:2Fe-2S iron-sulfur cluster-binding protein [Pyrobaculum ferrireducens]|uniref:Ferredoxin n=1 Tax=Pyrobaculum ferrireducens TaxID=1104324 RepID=G7VI74_9CREN|nr:2Fe-2S iron-sulfur cluster-binding protein [Pyrobaculum ferrireducens]AET32166.1 ferredoxin [Pyrobaculum ferrireducens]